MIEPAGFDGDDTLWHSEGHYHAAHAEFERIVGACVDLADAGLREHLLAVQRRNPALFGYGAARCGSACADRGDRRDHAGTQRRPEHGQLAGQPERAAAGQQVAGR